MYLSLLSVTFLLFFRKNTSPSSTSNFAARFLTALFFSFEIPVGYALFTTYSIARSRMGSSFSRGWSSSACSWFGSSSARSIRFSIAHSFCVPELHGSLLYTPSVSSQNRRFRSRTVGVPLQSVRGTAEGRSNKRLKAYKETFNYPTNCTKLPLR